MKITKHCHARGVHNGGHSIRKFLVLDLFGFPTEARVSAGSGKINRKMQVNFAAVRNDISMNRKFTKRGCGLVMCSCGRVGSPMRSAPCTNPHKVSGGIRRRTLLHGRSLRPFVSTPAQVRTTYPGLRPNELKLFHSNRLASRYRRNGHPRGYHTYNHNVHSPSRPQMCNRFRR